MLRLFIGMYAWLVIWPLKLLVGVFKWLFGLTGPKERDTTVINVVDGDTVDVEFDDGETDRVRLLGIDTPETDPDRERPENYEMDRDNLLNWAERAKEFATDNLSGKEVRVVFDSNTDRRGYYDRLLAYIYIGDENFNRTLVEEGYARVHGDEFSKRSEFDRAEHTAKQNRVGIWSDHKKSFWRRMTPLM
jgi:micrococcal nuclease